MSERTPIVEHDGMPHYEDINTPLIFMLTAIAAIVTYACVAAITGLFHQMKRERQAVINAQTVTMSADMIAQQKAALSKGDAEKNITPIEDAMRSTITSLGGEWKSEEAADHDHDDHGHTDHGHTDHGHTDHDHADHDHDHADSNHAEESHSEQTAEESHDEEAESDH